MHGNRKFDVDIIGSSCTSYAMNPNGSSNGTSLGVGVEISTNQPVKTPQRKRLDI